MAASSAEDINKEKQPVAEGKTEQSFAGQAWLLLFPPGPESAPEFLNGTVVFNAANLRPDTGIYLIFHAEYLVPAMFGVDFRNAAQGPASKALDNWENNQILQAQKLVAAFQKLGIKEIRKVCLVACATVNPKQAEKKAFLESFVIELHNNGYHPMVAGWDIPIEVVTDEKSPHYGRKQVQSKPEKLLAAERKDHKFVYVYTGGDVKSFNVSEKVANDPGQLQGKKDEALKDFKKNLGKHGAAIVENTLQGQTKLSEVPKSSKAQVDMRLEFVQRMRYTNSGWSG
jgi:hypothetical protein